MNVLMKLLFVVFVMGIDCFSFVAYNLYSAKQSKQFALKATSNVHLDSCTPFAFTNTHSIEGIQTHRRDSYAASNKAKLRANIDDSRQMNTGRPNAPSS